MSEGNEDEPKKPEYLQPMPEPSQGGRMIEVKGAEEKEERKRFLQK